MKHCKHVHLCFGLFSDQMVFIFYCRIDYCKKNDAIKTSFLFGIIKILVCSFKIFWNQNKIWVCQSIHISSCLIVSKEIKLASFKGNLVFSDTRSDKFTN